MCDLDGIGVPSIFRVIRSVSSFVYYETIRREIHRRLIYECRCDERLKTKVEGSTRLTYTGLFFDVCLL